MIWITNNQVAWLLDIRVGHRLMEGIYESPPGWRMVDINPLKSKAWHTGTGGELRRKEGAKK